MPSRVSRVADPMCGTSTARSCSSNAGCTSGSCSNTSSPAPPRCPEARAVGQRGLVHHRPAAGVDQDRAGLHQRQLGRADQMPGLVAERHGDGDEIRFGERRLQLGAVAADRQHPHREALCAAGDRPADAARSDHGQRLAVDVRAQQQVEAPLPPPAAAQVALRLAQPPRRGQDQRERQIGSRLGQHVRRVRDGDVQAVGGRQVDVVEADGHRRQPAQAGCRQDPLVDRVDQVSRPRRRSRTGPKPRTSSKPSSSATPAAETSCMSSTRMCETPVRVESKGATVPELRRQAAWQ